MDGDAFLKMDVFFFVTTTVVALVGVFVAVFAYYLIGIVRDVQHLTRTARTEVDALFEDIRALRTDVREGVHDLRGQVTGGLTSIFDASKSAAGAGLANIIATLIGNVTKNSKEPEKKSRTKSKKAS